MNDYDNKSLFEEFYSICSDIKIKNTAFFQAAYLVLIGKRRGPKLAHLILALGKRRVMNLLEQV